MSAHTPGPWAVFPPAEAREMTRDFVSHGVYRIYSTAEAKRKAAEGIPGCSCIGALVPGHMNDASPSEADARLIAAAPELARENRELRAAVGLGLIAATSGDAASMEAWIESARALLAKLEVPRER